MGYVEGSSIAIDVPLGQGRLQQVARHLRPSCCEPSPCAVGRGGRSWPHWRPRLQPPRSLWSFSSAATRKRSGLVASMNRPGIATGVNFFTGEMGGKRLELLCVMVPSAHVIGLLVNPRFGKPETAERQRQRASGCQPACQRNSAGGTASCKEAATWMPRSSRASAAFAKAGVCRTDRAERSLSSIPWAKPYRGALCQQPAARHFPYPGVSGGRRADELWR